MKISIDEKFKCSLNVSLSAVQSKAEVVGAVQGESLVWPAECYFSTGLYSHHNRKRSDHEIFSQNVKISCPFSFPFHFFIVMRLCDFKER